MKPRDNTHRQPPGHGRLLLILGFTLLVAACSNGGPMDSLDPQGPIAEDIDGLFKMTLYIATAIFIFVQGAILVAVFVFRDRGDKQGSAPVREPKQTHGNAKLEVVWTVIPVVILAAIAVPTVQQIFKYTECAPDALHINVIGHQWWFEYDYPDYDITTANVLVIPTDTEICLDMTSDDVIHNFWVPKLNGKRYLVPGQDTVLLLEAPDAGEYWGQCGEFCGLSHALMRARVEAMDQPEFDAWTQAQEAPVVEPSPGSLEADGKDIFLANQCVACHNIDAVNPVAAPIGPDLTHFASRSVFAGAVFGLNDPGALEAWLADPPEIKPGSFMPNLNLTQTEIDALSAYLRSLE